MGDKSNHQLFFDDFMVLDERVGNADQFFDFTFPILKLEGYV
ncbi:hypothetical protein [Gilliamella sp. wkB292]|nr:hypothetical protein [Gilliamella apicola]